VKGRCEAYDAATAAGFGAAGCKLDEPIEDIPFIPPAYGCETECRTSDGAVRLIVRVSDGSSSADALDGRGAELRSTPRYWFFVGKALRIQGAAVLEVAIARMESP
jgi:hypothetical protein